MDHSADAAERPRVRIMNGTAVDTVYGPVQAQIHLFDGEIISATAIQYRTSRWWTRFSVARRSRPLERAAMQSQSADIDTVSGATATSEGYKTSLQAALDAAQL